MRLGRLIVFSVPVVPLLIVASISSGVQLNPLGAITDRGALLSGQTVAKRQLPEIALLPAVVPGSAAASVTGSGRGAAAQARAAAPGRPKATGKLYALHGSIVTTWFYVGEPADSSNGFISNAPSAWQDDWVSHFGGVDKPAGRGFTPKENPYYFALPYNDFDADGNRKANVSLIPWARSRSWPADWSICKNQWIKISKGGRSVYAQWEDVGPFLEDDSSYVFGGAAPHNTDGEHAGLDVSPTVRSALGLSDVDKTSWQFLDASAVPPGPWRSIVTTSQTAWN